MNIIFFTQSNTLDTFYEIHKRIKKSLPIENVGYFVSNQKHYTSFVKKNEEFEKNVSVLKEWDIYKEASNHKADINRINKYQKDFGSIDLWTPYVTDRRLSFGKKYSFKQSYEPYFNFENILSIMDVSLMKINQLFESVKPDLICTIYTATFGDCLGHQLAKAKGIRAFDLRLSRLNNYVMFVDGVEEPPRHIKKIFYDKNYKIKTDLRLKAREYIDKVRSENALYDGALKASNQKTGFNKKPKNILKSLNNIIFYPRSKYSYDPQTQHPLTSLYYNNIYKKLNHKKVIKSVNKKLINEDYIQKNKYIFYPLHVEPELVLSQFARPYLNQIEVIRNIRYSTPLTKTILVKDHPLMFGKRPPSYYKKILDIPNVMLVNPSIPSEKILKNCELLVIIRGAMGLEAAIKKIPVICLGKTMFELLPRSMYRFCDSPYKLRDEILDLLNNYEFDEELLIRYLVSVMDGSCPVNLVTDLLGKKGRYSEGDKEYIFQEHPHLDILSNQLIKRIKEL